VSIVARNFGKLVFLALVSGIIIGVVLAQRGMSVDLGTIAGVPLALTPPARTPTSVVPAELFATPTPQVDPGRLPVTVSGAVARVDGAVIVIDRDRQTQSRAIVNGATIYLKAQNISPQEIGVGDSLMTIGRGAADGSVEAEYLMVSHGAQLGITGDALGATMIKGRVTAVSADAVTVEQTGGPAVRVVLHTATRMQRVSPASAADMAAGAPITVAGHAGDDGVIQAVIVQVGPLG